MSQSHSATLSDNSPFRFLFVDQSVREVVEAVLALQKSGLVVVGHTVTTRGELIQALNAGPWSVVIAGAELADLSMREALSIVRERDKDMPFILLSAAEDDRTIEMLSEGATEYVAKNNLLRLAPAARRAISEADTRRERNRLADELRRVEANHHASLGRMAATIAHQFNNVLMGVSSYIELLRRKPEEIERAIAQIGLAVSRGKSITHDILNYTSLPADATPSVMFSAEGAGELANDFGAPPDKDPRDLDS